MLIMAINNKKLLTILSTLMMAVALFADNGVNSPYSRFGLGMLSDQNLAINRQMGGLGYALRDSRYINLLNPASLAQADTLTMLFEAGFSLQNVNFKENGQKINAHNSSFDYIAMKYRIRNGLGMSFGVLPYSNVGYSFSSRNINIDSEIGNNTSSTNSYSGTGGIYQPFVALGWSPISNLSLGVSASYIYGDISHKVGSTFDDTSIRNRARYYNIDVSSYKVDFGAQYDMILGKGHGLTLGLVYSLGHDLNADAQVIEQTIQNGTIQVSDTSFIANGFSLPHTIGLGAVYNLKNRWKFGIDYTYQAWSSSDFFGEDKGLDRSKISVGMEYSPNRISRNILKRMNYRAGAYYAQPYTEVNGKEGCDEFGLSAGFSIPFANKFNRRMSMVHISGQVIRMEPKSSGMIAETCLRINLGITFNEGWFTKMKVE